MGQRGSGGERGRERGEIERKGEGERERRGEGGREEAHDVRGQLTGLFCLLELAQIKTQREEGSNDISPSLQYSSSVSVFTEKLPAGRHGEFYNPFLAFMFVL